MVLICDIYHDPITTLSENEIDYILAVLHKDLDNKGFWSVVEEDALATMEEIKDYFEKQRE